MTDSADDERVSRRLHDLERMGRLAAGIVRRGEQAYLAEGLDAEISRLAGRQLVIQVATVVEKLPPSFKDKHPDVEWVKIQRMRNLVAHHYDRVLDEFVFESLRVRVPGLLERVCRDRR